MKLEKLEIELQTYGENVGKYETEISYEGERGKVKLLLDPEISKTLLAFIGPVITQFAHKQSLALERDIALSIQEADKAPTLEIAATT